MAKRRYEFIEINGERFKLDTQNKVEYPYGMSIRTIDDCYDRPSSTKKAIELDWRVWFSQNDGWCTVASYNTFQFTLKGVVTDQQTGKKYLCYITSCHKDCIEIA